MTRDVEARICTIACSELLKRSAYWIMQAIADELIRLGVVGDITDSTVCEVMKKRDQTMTCKRMVHLRGRR